MAIDLTTDLIRQNLAVTLLPSRTAPRRPAPVSLPIADEPSRDEYVHGVTSIPALPPMPSSTSSSKQNRRNSTAQIHPTPGSRLWGSVRCRGPVLSRRRRSPAAPASHGGPSAVVVFGKDALYMRSTSSARRWHCRQQRTDLSPLVTTSEESRGVWLARRRRPGRRRRVYRRCAVNEF